MVNPLKRIAQSSGGSSRGRRARGAGRGARGAGPARLHVNVNLSGHAEANSPRTAVAERRRSEVACYEFMIVNSRAAQIAILGSSLQTEQQQTEQLFVEHPRTPPTPPRPPCASGDGGHKSNS
ncbi:unnamed protein product, partial [Brenthis ino]